MKTKDIEVGKRYGFRTYGTSTEMVTVTAIRSTTFEVRPGYTARRSNTICIERPNRINGSTYTTWVRPNDIVLTEAEQLAKEEREAQRRREAEAVRERADELRPRVRALLADAGIDVTVKDWVSHVTLTFEQVVRLAEYTEEAS